MLQLSLQVWIMKKRAWMTGISELIHLQITPAGLMTVMPIKKNTT